MMISVKELKAITQKLGLYPFVRSIYRQISPRLRKDRFYNKRFYAQLVSPDDLCFDIGANVGQTIYPLLDVNANIVAVEPNPNCIPVLEYQFKNNSNVTVIQKAMGATPGFAELHFNSTDTTDTAASIREDWRFASNDQAVQVEVTTLDNLIAEFGCPKFIKVDVEGFELEVFKGLSLPIPIICFEMHGCEKEQVARILERLLNVGEIAGVNAINAEHSAWLLDEWVKADRFLEKLGKPPHAADVVVKMRMK